MGLGRGSLEDMVRRNFEQLKAFYSGKRVLITGHTGFKGSYLTLILSYLGARIYGYALKCPTDPGLFEIMYGKGMSSRNETELLMKLSVPDALLTPVEQSYIADIRDFDRLEEYYRSVKPEIVLHLAAQPLVREGYRIPRETMEVNIMGTVNILECLRLHPGCVSFLNVTTDKVYQNDEREDQIFEEKDRLGGRDPYAASKTCSEIVTMSCRESFLRDAGIAVSTARAGNVIGGGDFSSDRIIPDCMRAVLSGRPVFVRNPLSVRPYQHVFEPLFAYLEIAMAAALDPGLAGAYNVGPDISDCVTTGELAELFTSAAGGSWTKGEADEDAPREAGLLRLDHKLIKETLGWEASWDIVKAVEATVSWMKAWEKSDEEANAVLIEEMKEFIRDKYSRGDSNGI